MVCTLKRHAIGIELRDFCVTQGAGVNSATDGGRILCLKVREIGRYRLGRLRRADERHGYYHCCRETEHRIRNQKPILQPHDSLLLNGRGPCVGLPHNVSPRCAAQAAAAGAGDNASKPGVGINGILRRAVFDEMQRAAMAIQFRVRRGLVL